MTTTLLDQFLSQECTQYVRQLLDDAIANTSVPSARFEFNRFEVTIQHEGGVVLLVDILEPADVGAQSVPLAEFGAALSRCSGR